MLNGASRLTFVERARSTGVIYIIGFGIDDGPIEFLAVSGFVKSTAGRALYA